MHTFSRRATGLALATLVILSSGCLSPYIKRSGTIPEARPTPAVVGGMVVRVGDSQRSIIDVAQDSGLAEFGTAMVEPVLAAVAARGYTLAFDRERSAALDALRINSDSATSALTGQWRHPDASYWTPDMVESPLMSPRDIVVKLRKEDAGEYFAFVGANIYSAGNIFKEPTVVLRVTIYDSAAKKVLDLQGIGVGETSILIVNRSPTNLGVALTRAIASLEGVPETAL